MKESTIMAKKTKKIARKVAKRYEFVEFESELFEGTFRLPKPEQMSLKLVAKLNTNPYALVDFLREAGVDDDQVEAVESLDPSELEDFMEVWAKGQVTIPKS